MSSWSSLVVDYWKVAWRYGRQFAVWSARNKLGIDAYPFMPEGDFGNMVHKGPQDIRVARSIDAIQDILSEAKARGVSVNICGAHHSMRGQTLSDGGIRLIPKLSENIEVTDGPAGPLVSIAASSEWEALTALHTQGLAAPVFTTHRSTTIAGTLSISGVGQRSYRFGRQIDTVHSMELVLPSGEVTTCSHTSNPELFRHTLSGLGATGVMTRVTLETIPYRPHLVHVLFDYAETSAYLEHAQALSIEPPSPWDEHLRNVWTSRDHERYTVHYGFEFERSEDAEACSKSLPDFLRAYEKNHYASRLTTFDAQSALRRAGLDALISGEWGLSKVPTHVPFWNEFVFPTFEAFATFSQQVEADLQQGSLERYYMGVYCLWLKQKNGQPHFPMSFYSHRVPSDSGYYYGYGLYFHVPKRDTEGLAALQAYYSRLQEFTHSLDGRLYNYSWHDWSRDTYREVYGQDWESLVNYKRLVDPEMILNPDALPYT